MIKKSAIIISFASILYTKAQDVSVVTNTVDVYSNSMMKGDAKFDAMAGSNGALGGSATALLTNPAGLGVAITSEVSASLNVHNYENKSTLGNNSINYEKSYTGISNVGGVATFALSGRDSNWKFANLGVNYSSRSLDNYVETPGKNDITFTKSLIDANNNPVMGNLAFQGHAYNRMGDQTKFSFGVGANYDNSLYFGMGLNFTNTSLKQYDVAALSLDLDNKTYEFSKQYTPYAEESSGFSATFGVIGKLSKKLRLGVALETPTWWAMDRVYSDYRIDANGYVDTQIFSEQRILRTPLKTTLSASYVPNKNLALNVDYTIGLSKTKYVEEGDAEVELNDFFNNVSKNTSEVRLGAEYRINALRLRAGYAYANNPFEKLSIDAINHSGAVNQPFLSNRSTLGLGVGYQFKSFFIDAAYQNIKYGTYQNAFMQGFENYESGYYSEDFDVNSSEAIISDVDKKQNNFTLSIGWKF